MESQSPKAVPYSANISFVTNNAYVNERESRADIAGRTSDSECRVLILGGDSDFNLGDQAILYAMCNGLHQVDPYVRITITSCRQHRGHLPGVVRVVPRGPRGLPTLLRIAKEQDLIIVGGGGLFQDDDSRIKMPYWGTRLKLLSRINPRIVGHGLGAGPLVHRESRWFAKLACKCLQHISVRDEFARGWLAANTDQPVDVVPDPAFMLPSASTADADAYLRTIGIAPGRAVIGVSLRRWFHPRGGFLPQKLRSRISFGWNRGARPMDTYLQQVARALRALAEELDASVLLMPTYNTVHEADAQVCRRLATLMPGTDTRLARIEDPLLYKAVCGRLSLMISSRMHPLILAAGVGVPGVGLGYNGKFAGFFDMLGGSSRLISLDAFSEGDQVGSLLALARSALNDGADLQHRADAIAQRAQLSTEQLLAASLKAAGVLNDSAF